MRRLTKLALLSLVVGVSAQASDINIGTSLVSGDVTTFERSGREKGHRDLSRGQLQMLSHRFDRHRSEWHGMTPEASDEPIPLQLKLKDNDGKTASIGVIARADGSHYLRFVSSGKWSFKSFGGLVKSAAATRPLSDKNWPRCRRYSVRPNGLSHK
jgi:hypothetical protein